MVSGISSVTQTTGVSSQSAVAAAPAAAGGGGSAARQLKEIVTLALIAAVVAKFKIRILLRKINLNRLSI